jgi:pimeloyl-ACP methyl ester carboxylesterase
MKTASHRPPALSTAILLLQVLTFDNRGIGASRDASPQQPRANPSYRIELLAEDVWRLIDHVWGPTQAVHLYGISMGGQCPSYLAICQTVMKQSGIRRHRLHELIC